MRRRRFIRIAAATAGLAALGGAPRAHASLHVWRGVALGAAASLHLAHEDESAAHALIARCTAEIERLEAIFSLFRESALTRLNAAGHLDAPPIELVTLLARAATVSEATGGVFDPTVQPLWQRYAAHFADPDADPDGPAVDDVLPLVDWRGVRLEASRVAFDRPGMAVTLNGIAQGWITDRVAELLRTAGMTSVLVDLGETRALGEHPAGRPWRIGIEEPGARGQLAGRLDLADSALATSGGYGAVFDSAGRHTHLLDPRTGRTAPAEHSVTVLAREATTADAYATAFALMPADAIAATARKVGGMAVHLASAGGLRRLV